MTIPRFRQSLAKILIQRSPLDLKRVLDGEEFKTTDAMDSGSVLDQIVFGGATYHETKDKWTTKAGRTERDEAKAKGLIPMRPGDVGELSGLAEAVKDKIQLLVGVDSVLAHSWVTHAQRRIEWTSDEGVECEGTPDLVTYHTMTDDDEQPYTLVKVYDLKCTSSAHPNTIEKHIYKMCWHVQAAAYKEAALAQAESEGMPNPVYGGHTIIAAESAGTNRVLAFPLSAKYIGVGKRQWVAAQETWLWCHKTGEWSDYEERELDPPHYALDDDQQGDDLSDLGLTFGDES